VVAVPAACTSFDATSGDVSGDGGGAESAAGEGGPEIGKDAASPADADAAPPTILTVAQEKAKTLGVAVDAQYIYWWSLEHSEIRKADKDHSATVSTVASRPGQTVTALAVDSSGVYWLESGPDADGGTSERIMRMQSPNAQPVPIRTSSQALQLLTVDAARVLSTIGTGIIGATKAGGTVDATVGLDRRTLASDGTDVFYTYGDAVIYKLKAAGGSLLVMSGLAVPHQLTFDGLTMYGLLQSDGGSAVFKADKTLNGGNATQTMEVTQITGGPVLLTIDSLGLVWANAGDGTIKRVPRTGGVQTEVVSGLVGPNAIAADARGVYWTTESGEVGWAQR
jgi:hypothetical protein